MVQHLSENLNRPNPNVRSLARNSTCSKEHFNMSFAFKTNEKRLASLPGASAILVLVPLGGGEDKQGGMHRGCTDHLAMNTIE